MLVLCAWAVPGMAPELLHSVIVLTGHGCVQVPPYPFLKRPVFQLLCQVFCYFVHAQRYSFPMHATRYLSPPPTPTSQVAFVPSMVPNGSTVRLPGLVLGTQPTRTLQNNEKNVSWLGQNVVGRCTPGDSGPGPAEEDADGQSNAARCPAQGQAVTHHQPCGGQSRCTSPPPPLPYSTPN